MSVTKELTRTDINDNKRKELMLFEFKHQIIKDVDAVLTRAGIQNTKRLHREVSVSVCAYERRGPGKSAVGYCVRGRRRRCRRLNDATTAARHNYPFRF